MSDTVTVKRADLKTLIEAGDALVRKLGNAPGIDVMRASYLGDWREAVEKVRGR